MTEDDAIDLAQELLKTDLPTAETAKSLINLEEYISDEIFGDLWEAMIVMLSQDELDKLPDA